MKYNDLFVLFIDELSNLYNSENQIIESLPKHIKTAQVPELKKALTNHLKETEHQVERIERIFSILDIEPKENKSEAMQGILKEADAIVRNKTKSPVLDAAIINAAQKVKHYEIASYGTLKSFAKHLDLDSEIIDLIDDILDEEATADKTLTKIATGSFFSSGVNQEAVEATAGNSSRNYRR
jgi:ferritin-like metal-binding protein YciE